MSKPAKFAYATFLSVFAASVLFASPLSLPTVFNVGDPLSAAAMNGNFSAVQTAVNDNDANITTNAGDIAANALATATNAGNIAANATAIAGKQQRVTGTCTVGSAVAAVNADGTVVCGAGAVFGTHGAAGSEEFFYPLSGIPSSISTRMTSFTMTVPAAGFVVVTLKGWLTITHTVGVAEDMGLGVNDAVTPNGMLNHVEYTLSGAIPSGTYRVPVSLLGVIPVSPPTATFNADVYTFAPFNSGAFSGGKLVALYFPARY